MKILKSQCWLKIEVLECVQVRKTASKVVVGDEEVISKSDKEVTMIQDVISNCYFAYYYKVG